MKKFLIITGLVIFSTAITGFGFEKKHIDPADTIRYIDKGNIYEYEMVEEIDLGEDVYRVWFGKDSEYPWLVKTAGKVGKASELIFFDDKFREIRRIGVGRVYPSPDVEYVGVTMIFKAPTKSDKGKMRFILLDKKGNKIWEKESDIEYDDVVPYYFVSDKGVVVEHSYKTLNFYDSKGKEIKKVELLYAGMEKGIHCGKFSSDGNYFVININDPEREIFSSGTEVILFTNRGEELWRFETEGNKSYGVHISPKGSYIVTSSSTWGRDEQGIYGPLKTIAYLFTRSGHLIREYPHTGSSDYSWSTDFSPSEDYAVIDDVVGYKAYLLDTKTGDKLFKFSLLGTKWHIKAVHIAEAGKLIGITYDNQVVLIQFNGIKAWSKEISNPENLWLNNNGDKFTIRSKNKLLRFEKVEGED
ncbi:WD40 repeat domain-containing protein [candidate division WOR-3 bacterium]|nr:WD40 repeat domain-containing protein [candidate division WOR-3 bacterium]